MKKIINSIMNACGCVDIKVLILLFFVVAILYSMYSKEINSMITGEDCDCKKS